jgi:hypothetical protein
MQIKARYTLILSLAIQIQMLTADIVFNLTSPICKRSERCSEIDGLPY